MKLNHSVSLGCIDYGNNNFFEIMCDRDGVIGLCSHEEPPLHENDDGSWDCEGYSLQEFLDEIKDRSDYEEIKDELMDILSQR